MELSAASADYEVRVYYDKIFGTLAFERESPTFVAARGQLRGRTGQVAHRVKIRYEYGGDSYVTYTGEDGTFILRTVKNTPGTIRVQVGGTLKELEYSGSEVSGIVIRMDESSSAGEER